MKFRVAEIFGPTIQGEGRNVGMPCYFVRFGGCDFRCSWCDTPHAVLPDQVRLLPQMDELEIHDKLQSLQGEAEWVVLTGGNPALFSLSNLIDLLHENNYKVMMETQGSIYKEWFGKIDDLCISPKPPSAGNTTNLTTLRDILRVTSRESKREPTKLDFSYPVPYLKVPIFTSDDLEYAEEVVMMLNDYEIFLSIGNEDPSLPTVGNPNPDMAPRLLLTRDSILDKFKDVVDGVLADHPVLQQCRIFPQQHVLLWGNERGH
jgi:7-carboxy-7-deazaguanine synthase